MFLATDTGPAIVREEDGGVPLKESTKPAEKIQDVPLTFEQCKRLPDGQSFGRRPRVLFKSLVELTRLESTSGVVARGVGAVEALVDAVEVDAQQGVGDVTRLEHARVTETGMDDED